MASVPEPFVTINGQMPPADVSLLLERRWFYSNLVENTADPSQEKNVAVAGLCADCVHARRIESGRGSVLILCELSGLSYAETAQVCGLDIGTVRSRLSRARSALA